MAGSKQITPIKQVKQKKPASQAEQKKPATSTEHKKPDNPAAEKEGGKPSKKKGAASKEQLFQTVWVGLDRDYMGRDKSDPDLEWFKILFKNSNFRFCGAYVSGEPPKSEKESTNNQEVIDGDFTIVSRRSDNGWMQNVNKLVSIGWGIAFFYVGYSDREQMLYVDQKTNESSWKDEPRSAVWLPEANDVSAIRARGTLHGKHIRNIIQDLGDSWVGSVVMIDNENNLGGQTPSGEPYNALSDRLKEYYRGIFEEFERPDDHLPALRPGFYGKTALASSFLTERPDLFVWEARYYTKNRSVNPYDPTIDPIKVVLTIGKRMHDISIKTTKQGTWKMWPLGRQFHEYKEAIPIQLPMKNKQRQETETVKRLKQQNTTWTPIKKWDFNTSLVRNPAFPVAEPRIAAKSLHAGKVVLVRGIFEMPESESDVPHMKIEELSYTGKRPIITDSKSRVEPEAPMLLTKRGKQLFLLTVLQDGRIAEAARDDQANWTPLAAIPGEQPALRRLRALCMAPRLDEDRAEADQLAFFIGKDRLIYSMRRALKDGKVSWSLGKSVDQKQRVHPFSSLCALDRSENNIELFFLDEQGLLTRAYSSLSSPRFQTLEKKASLLKGTKLACVMPCQDRLIVFGVGVDLRLRMASFNQSSGWSEMMSLGQETNRVGPHSQLSLYVSDIDSKVVIFAISPLGELLSFDLIRSGDIWELVSSNVIPGPPAASAKSSKAASTVPISVAEGWKVNPLGDLVFINGKTQEIYCAGIKDDQQQILVHSINDESAWQYYSA